MLNGKKILLGVTGGIAAYKTPEIVRLFKKAGASVKVITTPDAKEFVTPLTLSTLSNNPVLSTFKDEETEEWNNHVELALWADFFLIAPTTANTLAKMANGVCDNLLMAVYLSAKCPVYICPAMDLDMYKHPTTSENFKKLEANGNILIDSKEGELASGLFGKGRMEEPENIIKFIDNHLKQGLVLEGKKVLITGGGTHEKIDAVRFIGNNSSGKMGLALAECASKLGADVTLIMGPNYLDIKSKDFELINIVSADDMLKEVNNYSNKSDIIIMAAAVADYKPLNPSNIKLKKQNEDLNINLKPTQDILAQIGAKKKQGQLIVGFALETDNEIENAQSKLKRKNLDFIVLNSLNDRGAGFETSTNKITIIDRNNKIEQFELKSKAEVASDIFNKIISLLN